MNTTKFARLHLVDRVDFTEDLACFRFRAETDLDFSPGQYCTLGLEGRDGKPILRAYSIVSAPHEAYLELFIELVEDGALTPLIWPMRPGTSLWVRKKIVGQFTLEASMPRHVMAATVTGVAPYLSMARAQKHALDRGTLQEPRRFLILHGASHSKELGLYREELEQLAQEDWLTYIPTVSRPWTEPDWKGETGRVEDVLRKHMDAGGFDHTNAVAYACGHPQMIENAKGIFARKRFPKAHIREEKYFTEKDTAAPTPPSKAAPPEMATPPKKVPSPGKLPPMPTPAKAVKPAVRGKLPPGF